MKIWIWLPLLALWLVYMLPVVRRRLRAAKDRWEPWRIVLGGEMEERYGYLENVFAGNAELIDGMLGEGGAAREERTRESIGWALEALEGFSATASERLGEWRRLARVVEAEVPGPLRILRGGGFHLPKLRRLTWWQALRSWVTDRTFDLRLETLERGFGVVGRAGASLAARVATEVWAALCGRARHLALDFGTLSRESLASARALLKALERDRDPPR